AFTKRLAHENIKRRSQVHAQLIEKSVGLCFQIRVHADTDVCGISSHIIYPFLLALLVYAICTKKSIRCTNIEQNILEWSDSLCPRTKSSASTCKSTKLARKSRSSRKSCRPWKRRKSKRKIWRSSRWCAPCA